jgi:hypothetical protein
MTRIDLEYTARSKKTHHTTILLGNISCFRHDCFHSPPPHTHTTTYTHQNRKKKLETNQNSVFVIIEKETNSKFKVRFGY